MDVVRTAQCVLRQCRFDDVRVVDERRVVSVRSVGRRAFLLVRSMFRVLIAASIAILHCFWDTKQLIINGRPYYDDVSRT